jgi:predicted nucleic acid-binding protein
MEDMEFLKAMLAEMNANMKTEREEIITKMDANTKDIVATQEIMNEMKNEIKEAMRDKRMETNGNAWRKNMTACHEVTETYIEKIEPDSGMMQSIAEHQEAPKKDVIVKPVK